MSVLIFLVAAALGLAQGIVWGTLLPEWWALFPAFVCGGLTGYTASRINQRRQRRGTPQGHAGGTRGTLEKAAHARELRWRDAHEEQAPATIMGLPVILCEKAGPFGSPGTITANPPDHLCQFCGRPIAEHERL